MKRQRLLLLALVLGGCAYNAHDQAPDDRLVGAWYARANECVDVLKLDAGGAYSFDHMCELDDGSVGQQVHIGDYTATGSAVTLSPSLVSCPELDAQPLVVTYDLDSDDALRVTLAQRPLVLSPTVERLPTPATEIAYRFGCFASDGSFEPRPYEKL